MNAHKGYVKERPLGPFFRRTILSGTVSGLLMAGVIAAASRAQTGRAASGLNAVSHMLWGKQAGRKETWSFRYTASGLVLNQLACLFWSGCYEAICRERPTQLPAHGIPHVTILAFVAYSVDYHVVPERCTPGFELLFTRAWYPPLYAGLAYSLWAGAEFRDASLRGFSRA